MKTKTKFILSVVIIISIVLIIHLIFVNFYSSKTIQDELTGYEYKTYSWTLFIFHPPELILVFDENDISFELPMSNFVNYTPTFNGITIQEFKNEYVRVEYDENIYGYKIVRDIKIN